MNTGTVDLIRERSTSGTWGEWKSVTTAADSPIRESSGSYAVYRGRLNIDSGYKCTEATFVVNLKSLSSTRHSFTYKLYIYGSDPTANNPSSPPSGALAEKSGSWSIDSSVGTQLSVKITDASIVASQYFYLWVCLDYDAAYTDVVINGSTKYPRLSGKFRQAALSLNILTPSVATGSAVSIQVIDGEGYNLTATFKTGDWPLDSASFATGLLERSCSKSWFDEGAFYTQQQMTIGVEITGGPTTLTGTFTLVAGDDMRPVMGNPSLSINFPVSGAIIPGFSTAQVDVAVTAPTGAAISSVTLTYPGGEPVAASYSAYAGKYQARNIPISGNTTYTITAVDARGLESSVTKSLTGVIDYTYPDLQVLDYYRCDSNENADRGGEYCKVRLRLSLCTAVPSNKPSGVRGIKNGLMVSYVWPKTGDVYDSEASFLISGLSDPKSKYTIQFTISDKVTSGITREFDVDGIVRNFAMTQDSNGNTHLGIGMAPERTSGGNTVELPENGQVLVGDIPVQAIAGHTGADTAGTSFGLDFLSVDSTQRVAAEHGGAFFARPSASAANYDNAPTARSTGDWIGYRTVLWMSANYQMVLIVEIAPEPGRLWFNTCVSGTWSGWHSLTPTAQ